MALMATPSRLEPCHCDSGRRYKDCHGKLSAVLTEAHTPFVDPQPGRPQVSADVLRRRQVRDHGEGNPIDSWVQDGVRHIRLAEGVISSERWVTVPNFLYDYLYTQMGADWFANERAKPAAERSVIAQWLDEFERLMTSGQHGLLRIPELHRGVYRYLQLAYSLFTLHNTRTLHVGLLHRLRTGDNGVPFEVLIASMMKRAGFELTWIEPAQEVRRKIVEFNATHLETGRVFSVEARHRESRSSKGISIQSRLFGALRKGVEGERLVFLDPNVRDTGAEEDSILLQRWRNEIEAAQDELDAEGIPWPSAYVLIVNMPWRHAADMDSDRNRVEATGFRISDFPPERQAHTLDELVRAREKHRPIVEMMQTMQRGFDVPSTFDGSIPEYEQTDVGQRIEIGDRYFSDAGRGRGQGQLVDVFTHRDGERAIGVLQFHDGSIAVKTWTLTEDEKRVIARHPETAFGRLRPSRRSINSPIESYEWAYALAATMSRETALRFMRDAPILRQFEDMSDRDLHVQVALTIVHTIYASRSVAETPSASPSS